MSWVAAAIGIASSLYQGHQADEQGQMAKKAMKDMNPFAPYRKQYAEMLGKLMDDPASFLDNPLYQAAFDQGTQAVMRGFAGEGFLGSGNMATGLQSFGMSFANDMFKDMSKFIAHLAGADIGGSAGPLQGLEQSYRNTGDAFGQLGAIFEGLPGMASPSGSPGAGAYSPGAGGVGPYLPAAPSIG